MSCTDCFKGVVHDYASPAGSVETIHGVPTYIALSAADCQSSSKSTIIFITDAFGFNLDNSKLLADVYASRTGIRVLLPDIIPGGGVPLSSLALMERATAPVAWWDVLGQIRRIMSGLQMMAIFMPFAIRTRKIFPSILHYARAVRADLPVGGKLGVAGMCWGGLQTTKLTEEAVEEGGKEALVDAHFTAHPAGLKSLQFVESFQKFHVPFSMAVGDRDFVLSKDQVATVEASFRMYQGKGLEYGYEVKVYEGCGHGFAVRADPKKIVENEAAIQASNQAVEWFKKYL